MTELQPPEKTKGAAPEELAPFAIEPTNRSTEKVLSTIRARLCQSGGQRLHVADGGVFFVTNLFGQITQFNDMAALAAHADRGAR